MLLTLALGVETRVSVWFRRNKHLLIPEGRRPYDIDGFAEITPWVSELIHECWSQDPYGRPSFSKILERFRKAEKIQNEFSLNDGPASSPPSANFATEPGMILNERSPISHCQGAGEEGPGAGMAAQVAELKRILAKNEAAHRNEMMKMRAELLKKDTELRRHREEAR